MDVARTAEKSKLFNHCSAWWSEKTVEIYQLVDGVTQHSGDAGGSVEKVQVVFSRVARMLATKTSNSAAAAMGGFRLPDFPDALQDGRYKLSPGCPVSAFPRWQPWKNLRAGVVIVATGRPPLELEKKLPDTIHKGPLVGGADSKMLFKTGPLVGGADGKRVIKSLKGEKIII